ncbi:MAG TPA: RnfABCDGE type electron transport complex subunit D [Bacilli bacterium]|nr:RnfABCDGE type electron transport complex subunit D [Bacilli bacterium]
MSIITGTTPFNRQKRGTGHIMRELLIGLGVIFVAAVVFNFTLGVSYGVKAILMMVVSIVTTWISDIIAASLRYNKKKHGQFTDYLVDFVTTNFSVVTAVIFTLTLPIGTPYYVVIVGSIFATLVVKHVFGGFGHNIFNPAALGRLFVTLTFGPSLVSYLSDADKSLGGLTAGMTVTGHYAQDGAKWLTGSLTSNVSMLDLYLGNYSAAIGETFTLLIIVVGIVLAIRNVINWRTPTFLFGTVALSSLIISLIAGVNVGEYLLLQFGLGGLAFGAIFMFTDPVTSPTSNTGKSLIGVLGGLFIVLIRVAGSYPEGVAFSIALVNVFSPMIDKLIVGRTNVKVWKPYAINGTALFVSLGVLAGVSALKMPEEEVIEPVESVFSYSGTYTSPAPSGHSSEFTTKATVGLDRFFNITDLELEEIASPATYVDDERKAEFVDYYTSINVAEFKALPVVNLDVSAGATQNPIESPHIMPGLIYTSIAIHGAINEALSDINVYVGQETSPSHDPAQGGKDLTMEVVVYVDVNSDTIKTVDIVENATSGTPNFLNKWNEGYEEVVSYYEDVDVATFLAYASYEEFYSDEIQGIFAGVTYSGNRLFKATQNALEGYGA